RIAWLGEGLDADAAEIIGGGAVALVEPAEGRRAEVEAALIPRGPHHDCWRREDVPERLAYGRHRRIPAIVCLAEVGWSLAVPGRTDPARINGGAHGYDNAAPQMRALFVAHGPSFRPGARLDDMDSVDVQ